ncbi:MAG: carboxylesterase family protein [Nevskiales bacterium]|nr:carboxylesterase family protein [Nevskiales bacterium]
MPEAAGGFAAGDETLSQETGRYWIRFAKNGNPNGPAAVTWPAFDNQKRLQLNLGVPITVGEHPKNKKLDFLDKALVR